jgi:protein phosphatase
LQERVRERELGSGRLSSERVRRSLARAVREPSGQLRGEAEKRPDLAGMGATVALALLAGHRAHVAHLGDSRAYLLRRGRLQQLTKDHTVAAALLHLGEISEGEALAHPARHRLTRYIGMESEAVPDLRVVALEAGDRLLLCSDGLTGMVPDRRIAQLMRRQRTPKEACKALVAAANAAGGRDNVSAIVIDIGAVFSDIEQADGE